MLGFRKDAVKLLRIEKVAQNLKSCTKLQGRICLGRAAAVSPHFLLNLHYIFVAVLNNYYSRRAHWL